MNRKVYLLSVLLVVIAAYFIQLRLSKGEKEIELEFDQKLWRVSIVMEMTGQGERSKVRLTLPQSSDRQKIYNETFDNDELVFYIRDRQKSGNRIGFWRAEILEGVRTVKHNFSVQLKKSSYSVPNHLNLPKAPYDDDYPESVLPWLDASKFILSNDEKLKDHLSKVIGKEKNISFVVRKIFDFVKNDVRYSSEKGSKNSEEVLDKLVADCGGQARLFTALSRAAGIPSRVVGGLVLERGVKKITHVWAENYIGNRWIPFDVVNNHYASLPENYLVFYRGDYALIKHLGLSDFSYYFVMGKENIPPLDNPWSLYAFPVQFQKFLYAMLMIPIGALIVSLSRVVIGIPTFGTFTPVLLALAFREITLSSGLMCLGGMLFGGLILRWCLEHLKILIIPRLSILVTCVLVFMLGVMLIGLNLDRRQLLYVSLFPVVIITWIIERFAVIQIEDGFIKALQALLGTALVAIGAFFVMNIDALRNYFFSFPELLLVILAALLVLGRYTGLRFTEIFRFAELRRLLKGRKKK